MCVPERGNPTGEHQDPEEPNTRLSQQRSGTTTGGAEPRGRTTLSLRDRFQASRATQPQQRPLNRLVSASQTRGLAAESSTFEFLLFAASEQVGDLTANAKNQDAAMHIAEADFSNAFDLVQNVKETFSAHTGEATFDTTGVFNTLVETLGEIDAELTTRRANYTFAGSLRVCRTVLQSLLSTVQAAQQRYAAEQREANPAQAPSPSGGWGKTGFAETSPLPDTFEPPAPAPTPAKQVKRKGPSLLD